MSPRSQKYIVGTFFFVIITFADWRFAKIFIKKYIFTVISCIKNIELSKGRIPSLELIRLLSIITVFFSLKTISLRLNKFRTRFILYPGMKRFFCERKNLSVNRPEINTLIWKLSYCLLFFYCIINYENLAKEVTIK